MEEFRQKRLEVNKKKVKQVQEASRDPVEYNKQFLKHREFFAAIEKFKEHLEANNPEFLRSLEEDEFFDELHPSEFTADAIMMPTYPGSLKGTRPEDDPESFIEW